MPEEQETKEITKFGTFQGVFVPTVLTILGVIMFLRLGWVVGKVGVVGAWAIILLAFFITSLTALSMSSIVTNMKIGSGGAYSIISRSLGLEVGGSIGVPLYLSLSLSTAMYIFGFRAGLRILLPDLSSLLIDFVAFGFLFGLVFLSTAISFRLQYVILAVVIASLASVIAGGPPSTPALTVPTTDETSILDSIRSVFSSRYWNHGRCKHVRGTSSSKKEHPPRYHSSDWCQRYCVPRARLLAGRLRSSVNVDR